MLGWALQLSMAVVQSLNAALCVCRPAFATMLAIVIFLGLFAAGMWGLIYFVHGISMRQAERQLDMEAAHIAKHLVSMEPEGLEGFGLSATLDAGGHDVSAAL